MSLKQKNSLPLDKFINLSLYDKKSGYYMKKNVFGKKGDFTTAPNISRLFSEMIAIWIVSFWQNIGSPKKFNLIELGAGNGEMMKIMIESFKRFPIFLNSCNFYIHEISPKMIQEQKIRIKEKKVRWIKNLSNLKKVPCLFLANEFFDAMPIKQFIKKDSNWYEKQVILKKNNQAIYSNKKINIQLLEKKLKINISKNQTFFEYSPRGVKYLKKIIKIVEKNDGGLLIVDYGYDNELAKNTLQAIYNKKYSNVLRNIGDSDITHSLNYSFFRKISQNSKTINVNFTTQKKFLTKIGIERRAEILSRNKSFKQKADIFYRLQRLIDKKQMGDLFKVMLIKKANNNFKIGF